MASFGAILRQPRLLATGVAVVIGGASWLFLSSSPDGVRWSEGRGPVPQRFACLMFPRSGETFVFSVEEASILAPLDRAMLNDWSEITAAGFVEAWYGDVPGRVAVEDLRYLPDPASEEDPVELWKETVLAWGEHRSIEVDRSPFGEGGEGGEELVVRRTRMDGGWESFRYRTDGDSVRPLEWRVVTEAGGGIRGAMSMLVSGVLALAAFVVSLSVARIAARLSGAGARES